MDPMRVASRHRPPGRCTSAARARRCSTGCSRATAAASWCCASRTPTASARRRRTSSRSSTRCAGWSSTGTRGRSCRRRAPSATARRCRRCSSPATRTARTPTADDVKAFKELHGADRGFRGEGGRDGGGGAPARARRGRDGRARRDPRRHALRARAPRRPRDRARRRLGALQLRGRDRRPRRRASRTWCAARTTSRTRPSSCSCSRPRAPRASGRDAPMPAVRAPAAAARARTARSSPSATAPPPCRSCATRATCPRRCATTSRCSAGAPATTRRCSSTEELIERFTLERVSRNPARFDEVKLRWLNGLYIRKLPVAELDAAPGGVHRARRASRGGAHQPGEDPDARRLLAARGGAARRPARGSRRRASAGSTRTAARRWPRSATRSRTDRTSFDEAAVEQALAAVIERRGAKPREVYQPLRVALTGTTVSPGIFESVALLGREETLRRIDARSPSARPASPSDDPR